MTVALFIDANQYLKLYEIAGGGKQLLEALTEQRSHLFIAQQTVHEVQRNKLVCAARFFTTSLRELSEIAKVLPDHLLDDDEDIAEIRESFIKARDARNALEPLAKETLLKISRSEDRVSQRLKPLFDTAIPADTEHLDRARRRREVGNPPGKKSDPLGDQIAWEQFLTYCKDKQCTKLWIITDDNDFVTTRTKHHLLNPFLFAELQERCITGPEVHCFRNLMEGLKHFGKNAGVPAEKLPTTEQTVEIEKVLDSVPPPIMGSHYDANYVAQLYAMRQRGFAAALIAAAQSDTPLPLRADSPL